MSPTLQVKLLRALQERKVRPVGGDGEIAFDARLVAATSCDLEAEVAEHRFREDLYYRINVIRVDVPPLRGRGTDILRITEHFIASTPARPRSRSGASRAPRRSGFSPTVGRETCESSKIAWSARSR
jgi:two-component system, NtrC family, response regulator AtoC